MKRGIYYFEGWRVELTVDDDGHLTVGINHQDGTKVNKLDFDLATNDEEWVERFSTEKIEQDYIDSLDHEDNLSDVEADAMTLASAGMGTDEDYGG